MIWRPSKRKRIWAKSCVDALANAVIGVQPMSGPTGLIFAMKSKYREETEGDEKDNPYE